MEKHRRFMQIALDEARQALAAGEFPVGCAIVHEQEVVAVGGRKNSVVESELDHAEIVALRDLHMRLPEIDLQNVTVYSTMEPCLMCFSTMLVNNVRRMVFGYEDVMGGGTKLPLHSLPPLYASMDIEVIGGVMRNECMALFQQFFADPANTYLEGSLLAQYTLAQSPGE